MVKSHRKRYWGGGVLPLEVLRTQESTSPAKVTSLKALHGLPLHGNCCAPNLVDATHGLYYEPGWQCSYSPSVLASWGALMQGTASTLLVCGERPFPTKDIPGRTTGSSSIFQAALRLWPSLLYSWEVLTSGLHCQAKS